jgi:hypothetical protein
VRAETAALPDFGPAYRRLGSLNRQLPHRSMLLRSHFRELLLCARPGGPLSLGCATGGDCFVSLYPLYFRRCTILPATSAKPSIVCQHLPVTSAQANNICQQSVSISPSIWAKHLKNLSQHLAGSPVCCALWASIPSISPLLGHPSIYFGRGST